MIPTFDPGSFVGKLLRRCHAIERAESIRKSANPHITVNMSDSVEKWLERLGLGRYAAAFAEQQIDHDVLPELTDEHLKELGLSLGDRLRLLKAIAALSRDEHESSDSLASIPPETSSPLPDSDASLAAWERMPGERKPVTMLFADITGSTALTEKLDSEETHDLLYGATRRMCEAVENNRGTVCRFMGDGVMAMFGAPVASEHHAVDACQAALEMQQAIRHYAEELEARHDSGVQIRVGLHSGEVVVLTVGEGDKVEYDASGPTVPIAARMEQTAEPGKIYLTTTTHSLAKERIEAVELEPVSIKGISEPVQVFALQRVRAVEERAVQGSRTPFVGRRAELAQFTSLVEACLSGGHGETIYVRGEAGIGKTRLVEEFTRIAATKGVACHRGLVLDFGVGKGQDAIQALVRSLLGAPLTSGEPERQQAADAAISEGLLDKDERVYLNDLLDLPQATELHALYDAMDSATRNQGKQEVVVKLVSKASDKQPVLTIVEDVHWAEPITLAHLAALTKAVAESPSLLVMTSRIEGDPLDQTWRNSTEGSPFITIDLGPLRRQESIDLINEFIDSGDPLAQGCLERAAGNPLFLEQLLRNAQEGSVEGLPDSIQSLVLARIDRLVPTDKRALQAAAVIGQRFEVDILRHLLEEPTYDCRGLVEHNLVRSAGAAYLFAHALIQEGVYGSLLKRQRRDLHGRAAEWFTDSDSMLHAEHLDRAGDEKAPAAYLAAAREQAQQYRYERALELVNRALEIVPDADSFALKFLQGELLRNLGSVPESIAVYRQASELALGEADRCRAWIGVAEGLRITEEHDELLETLDRAETIAKAHNISPELARISQLKGGVHFMRGEIDHSLHANTRALKHARDASSPELEAHALSGLGDAEYARGRMISAYGYYHECIELGREHGFGRVVAANLPMRADTLFFKNEIEAAVKDFRTAVELAAKTRQPRAEMLALGEAGFYMWEMGNLDEGREWSRKCLDIARRLGSRLFQVIAIDDLINVAIQEGRRPEAEALAQEAIAIMRESEFVESMMGPIILARLALATDDPQRRRLALEEGEALLDSKSLSHNYLFFYRDAMDVCLQMAEWGEVERYAKALEDYTRDEPLPWSNLLIARGRALSAYGGGSRDDATMRELQRLYEEAKRVRLEAALPALEAALSAA